MKDKEIIEKIEKEILGTKKAENILDLTEALKTYIEYIDLRVKVLGG